MPNDQTIDLAGDVTGPGVRRIAEAAGLPYQVTRGLIDAKRLPVFKIGGRWYARRSELAAVLTAYQPAEPAPAPVQRRRRGFAAL